MEFLGKEDVRGCVAEGVDDCCLSVRPERRNLFVALILLAPHVPAHGEDASGGSWGEQGQCIISGGRLFGFEIHDTLALGAALVSTDRTKCNKLTDFLLSRPICLSMDCIPGLVTPGM